MNRENKLFPIFLNLHKRRVLIVGGGKVALEKLYSLSSSGACISVVGKIILPEIKSFKMEQCSLDYMEREFKESDLVGIDLLFSATNNSKVNQSITDLAKKHKIWANSVDDPLHCDFFSAAVFDRGPVRIALSTDGKFAGLSGSLKRTLEKLIPEESDEDFQKLMDLRTKIKLIEPNAQKRSDILKGIIRELEYKYFTVEK